MTGLIHRRQFIAGAILAPLIFRQASAAEDATALLQEAADVMRGLDSIRWKLEYVDGNTEIFSAIHVSKGHGAYTRPNLLEAEAEAKAGFVGIDVHAVSNGERVWVEAVRYDRTIDPSESLSRILSDPLEVVAVVLEAVDQATVTKTEEVNGETWTTISGMFEPSLVTNPDVRLYLDLEEPMPVEVVLDEQRRVVSAQQSGPVVGYDSDDVVRKVSFWDYNEPISIEIPE